MEFKSQIATTRDQSEILLSLGLKPETADMVYHHTNSRVKSLEWELQTKPPTLRGKYWTPERIAKLESPFHKHPDGTLMTGEEIFDALWGKDVPAWSLTRIQKIMPKDIVLGNNRWELFISTDDIAYFSFNEDKTINYLTGFDTGDDVSIFNAAIGMFEWLIENNHLNPEYLKEKP